MSTHAAGADHEIRDLFVQHTAPRSVVLIGFMGSGKSSVARNLAKRLGCRNIDLDALIEERCGCSVANYFARHGETAFRETESDVLEHAMQRMTQNGGIMATGGGIAKCKRNREVLQSAAKNGVLVVYLRARVETLARRIRRQPGKRPLIDGDGVLDMEQTQKRVGQLLSEREADYQACASLVVDTDTMAPRRAVELIASRLQQTPR